MLLGREDNFADSLTSGGLQGLLDAPLLLTATGELDERVEAELARLGAERVSIMGGTNAVSQAVEDALVALGYEVTRIAGTTRLETAAAAAEALIGDEGIDPTTAIVARAYEAEGSTDPTQAFADSLAAGGAAARESIPILLSETGLLSATTTAFFEAHPEITTVYVVGGIAALSQQVEDDLIALGLEVIRVAGATRFDTASRRRRAVLRLPGGVPADRGAGGRLVGGRLHRRVGRRVRADPAVQRRHASAAHAGVGVVRRPCPVRPTDVAGGVRDRRAGGRLRPVRRPRRARGVP